MSFEDRPRILSQLWLQKKTPLSESGAAGRRFTKMKETTRKSYHRPLLARCPFCEQCDYGLTQCPTAMVNITRAKDAAIVLALEQLNQAARAL